MRFSGFALLCCAVLALLGCAPSAPKHPDASPEAVARAAYRHDGPPALTLYTMVNNRSGAGAHSSIMINASQRVIFDPAGSVRVAAMPELNDVLYGVTPPLADFYARAHARETFHVRIQRVEVSPQVAEKALQLARQYGSVGSARCTIATSGILQQLPGFEGIKTTWFPNNLADQLAQYPLQSDRRLYEDDADDKSVAIEAFRERRQASQ